MPELAKKITIDRKHHKVYIDGTEFPYAIAERGPDIESADEAHAIPIVSLPILTADLEIIPGNDEA